MIKPIASEIEGFVFDVYNFEDDVFVWIIDDQHRLHLFRDKYHPVIYAAGPDAVMTKFLDRLRQLDALHGEPRGVVKKHFYRNDEAPVLEISITRPSVLPRIRRRLYAFYGRLDIYHSDIEIPTAYMFDRGIHPFARVSVLYSQGRTFQEIEGFVLKSDSDSDSGSGEESARDFANREDPEKTAGRSLEYDLPDLRILRMYLKYSHRLPIGQNTLVLEPAGEKPREIPGDDPLALVDAVNDAMLEYDPDVLLTSFGDQTILPFLFETAQKHKRRLYLDRDAPMTVRKIVTKGHSYNTYGSWIYVAPAYPLFGRLHVDSANSFVYKESELVGVIELARLSCIPVQRMARSSTGAALTAIETRVALNSGYLVPWQKSAAEEPKTAYELLTVDKGGVQFVPDVRESCVYENMAQLDFSQMYPSIMVIHNISPETVNCLCCRDTPGVPRVPEANYRICIQRRGIVAEALEQILLRRAYYKKRKQQSQGLQREIYDAMQSAIKWMLVTSFGYLGYRNAKFGRIESHESVTAFGREKLLSAKEAAEDRGYDLVHGITDSIFIKKAGAKLCAGELSELCEEIYRRTRVQMAVDGVYTWVVFLPSKADPALGVMTRYFGRFTNGELKIRGIAARRKDTPEFLREAQLAFLEVMRAADSVSKLRELHPQMDAQYRDFEEQIVSGRVSFKDLLIRRKVTRGLAEYKTPSIATVVSLRQIQNMTGAEIQAGDRVRYLAVAHKHRNPNRRWLSEEAADRLCEKRNAPPEYDVEYYRRLLWEVYREVWDYFAPEDYFLRSPGAQLWLEL
ncbi:MAG: DNA polymerase [bacterium]|nr:DNA polymerase [bacterium]